MMHLEHTEHDGKEVSLLQGLWAGITAFAAGAIVAGTSHFAGTAKALEEEGISRAQRLQALPTAAKALAVSTALCVSCGVAGFVALRHWGLDAKEKAEVATLHDTICLAEEQRALVREQFRKRLHQWQAPEQS